MQWYALSCAAAALFSYQVKGLLTNVLHAVQAMEIAGWGGVHASRAGLARTVPSEMHPQSGPLERRPEQSRGCCRWCTPQRQQILHLRPPAPAR